ncbi:hypothetical protein ECBCE007MS11_0911 [Escherichia coli BCE007_MS-11]|nr:hypothetical protein EC2872000_0690 [Escherichia coli 2872000]EMV64901.1 hypothetical protein EC2871950_0660 [Escherichia coli 2871950]ENA34683.1 hypothetical protein ECBCE007MS11_0911 [Escherichia coli BCE007_MS-11]EYD91941.1 hypothetical protein AB98_0716 [Escherichia coli 1-176-05_S3_C1]KDV91741.1 hypothetical protein AD25_0708 [Escherichia coli 2-052-05_S4_C3]KDW11215.1 hypothetical protein AC43_0575 [Escherichia coli 2-156-04_S3_C3]KEM94915.1 hypothetical protein AC92_0622 [Escherichi
MKIENLTEIMGMIDEKKSGREDLHRFCQSCVIVGCDA